MSTADTARYEPIIGLEIHVQLATRSKMFCACPLRFGAEPNTCVCPVCLGLPGALPVINRHAIELAVRCALALNCRIAGLTRWDRKSYYYPDLPKNYQISQFDQPLGSEGYLEFAFEGQHRRVRIKRAHLEEDAGKSVHDFPGCSAIDLNRAGTPLLEIVSEPDLRSAEEAREFAVQLQRLVRYLGVSEANMQQGQMRFEPNINLRVLEDGREFRTPIVEVKNLNSFRSVHSAVAFELERQRAAWREQREEFALGNKTNRGWDDARMVTLPQRQKEEAHEYRYFPDPDLPTLQLEHDWIESLREEMPELPLPRTERFVCEYRVPAQDAPALVDDRATADLLDAAADAGGDKLTLAKQFLGFWAMHANARQTTIAGLGIAPQQMAELSRLVADGAVNATAAAQIAEQLLQRAASANSAYELARELGLLQTRDSGALQRWVDQAFSANAKAVRDALENPKKLQAARGFLLGQVMKLSGGKADPKLAGELIEAALQNAVR